MAGHDPLQTLVFAGRGPQSSGQRTLAVALSYRYCSRNSCAPDCPRARPPLGRPAGRCRTGLGCPGPTVTRGRLQPGSAVVAAFRPLPSSAPAADAPSPAPRPRPTTPQTRSAAPRRRRDPRHSRPARARRLSALSPASQRVYPLSIPAGRARPCGWIFYPSVTPWDKCRRTCCGKTIRAGSPDRSASGQAQPLAPPRVLASRPTCGSVAVDAPRGCCYRTAHN